MSISNDQRKDPDLPLRILLVDDDPIFNKLMARVARKIGAQLTALNSPTEYKNMIASNAYDIIVLDYFLRGKESGADLAKMVCKLPVVIVSQRANLDMDSELSSYSIRAFIRKSVGVEGILAEVVKLAKLHPQTQASHDEKKEAS